MTKYQQLTATEITFIKQRDSFYYANIDTCLQPSLHYCSDVPTIVNAGLLETSLLADNIREEQSVSLLFIDYRNHQNLSILSEVYRRDKSNIRLRVVSYCWQQIKQVKTRYNEAELNQLIAPLQKEHKRLKQQLTDNDALQTEQHVGQGELALVISGIRQLTPNVRAYQLRHIHGHPLPVVSGGSHLRCSIKLPKGEIVIRHYSICSDPNQTNLYEIAVLHEPDGQGGSDALFELYQLGTRITCPVSDNFFGLANNSNPVVLIAGGIGITPIKSMAHELLARGVEFELHYAIRNRQYMAFIDDLQQAFPNQLHSYDASKGQRLNLKKLLMSAPPNAHFYCCGPLNMLQQMQKIGSEQGISPQRLHVESFTHASHDDSQPVELFLQRSNQTIQIKANESLLDGLLNAGIELDYCCETGTCKSCVVRVIDGEPLHRDVVLSEQEKRQQKLFCPCVSRATTKKLTLDI